MPKVLSDRDARTLAELVTWYRRNKGRLASDRSSKRPHVFGKATPEESESISEPSISEPSISEPSVSEPSVSEPSVSEPSVSEPSVSEPSVSVSESVSESADCITIPGVSFSQLPVISANDASYVLGLDSKSCLALIALAPCETTDASTGGGGTDVSESAGGGGGGGGGGAGGGGGLP